MFRYCFLLIKLLILVSSGAVYSAKLDVAFSQFTESSSNFLHVPDVLNTDDKYQNTINTTTAAFKLDETYTSVVAKLDYSISYINFDDNDFATDLTKNNLAAELTWTIDRGFYYWYMKDSFSQTTIDNNQLLSEENSQDINEFVTGPQLRWNFGNASLDIYSYIRNFDYSETDTDTTSVETMLNWGRKIPGGMFVSLKYTTKYVSYDQSNSPDDYDLSTLGLNFDYKRGVDGFNTFLGATFYNKNDQATESATTSFDYKRQTSRVSNLSLSYSNQVSDLNNALDTYGTPIDGLYFDEKTAINYQRKSELYILDLKYIDQQRSDTDTDNEDNSKTGVISVTRVIGGRSRVVLSYSDQERVVDVSGVAFDYIDNIYTSKLEYQKRFNNKLSMRLYASDLLSKSTAILRQYTDTRIGLMLTIAR